MKTFKVLLIELNACLDAKEWAKDMTIEDVIKNCHRGDWLLWLAKKINLPLNKLTLAKARCAKTVIHLMKDQRSINAINVAERFGLDECTLDELNAAAYAAYAAAADAAYAAYADDAAAYAAAAAAYADAAAAYAAYADAAAADADANHAAYAKIKNQKQTASICREVLGELIIEKINQLLN